MTHKTTIRQTQRQLCNRLQKAGIFTALLDVDVLLSHVLKKPQEYIFSHPEAPVSKSQLDKLSNLIQKRCKHMPLAYLTGVKEFYGYTFKVNSSVLIPRPETEALVDGALEIIKSNPQKPWRIVDVGTGSGAIIIAIARKCKGNGWAWDKYQFLATEISKPALNIARSNAKLNNVQSKIKFRRADLLTGIKQEFDIVIANLPYVPLKEYIDSPCFDVIKWEPRLAITDNQDGLSGLKRLLKQLPVNLKQGRLLLEMGYNQGKKISHLIRAAYPDAKIQIKKDLAGFDRIVIAKI